jgi:hypothetical protein
MLGHCAAKPVYSKNFGRSRTDQHGQTPFFQTVFLTAKAYSYVNQHAGSAVPAGKALESSGPTGISIIKPAIVPAVSSFIKIRHSER